MIENIRLNYIEVYDMTRPPSKNPVYRRWQGYGAPPTLHGAVGMYAIGLGRFHVNFREALRIDGRQWFTWSDGMKPVFDPRNGNVNVHGAPIKPVRNNVPIQLTDR